MSHLILIACCVLGSAFFSGAETAFVSVNRIKIRHLVEQGDRNALAVEKFLERPDRFLSVTLVGNNIFVVLGSILAATYLTGLLDHQENLGMVVATIVMTPLMLIFAETLPKALFYHHATSIVLGILPVMKFFLVVFYPMAYIGSLPAKILALILKKPDDRKNPFVTREELRVLMLEGRSHLDANEQKMIHHLFRFTGTVARSVMIPLDRVVSLDVTATVADAASRMRETGHSRLPLYEGRTDHIVGYVAVQDIVGREETVPLSRLRRPIIFVSEGRSISWLLLHLKQVGQHFAMVVNRYRRTTGLVTLEDIVEEIVGEIEDEYDSA